MGCLLHIYTGLKLRFQFRTVNVNEGNSLEHFSCIKYLRLHRQLEALQRAGYSAEFSRYYVNS